MPASPPDRRPATLSRRAVLKQFAAAPLALAAGRVAAASAPGAPRVAALFTEFTHRSHAHVLLENFLEPYLFNGQPTQPGVEVVSFYADQLPSGDMARDVARQYGIPLFGTIREALCVGGDELAVDAVLSIGEHGKYPVNELGQREYPRKRFFDEAVAVMRNAERFVPLFNDKHLSYRWDWAREMYDTTRRHGIPFMAGSSVPLAQRRPPLELPAGFEITEAVSIHGGPVESYDFHGLEVLQSLVEARRAGETGVSRVEFLDSAAVKAAVDAGRVSAELVSAAMAAETGRPPAALWQVDGEPASDPHGILLTYRDGLQAAVLKIGSSSTRWNFAGRLADGPATGKSARPTSGKREAGEGGVRATSFYVGPWQNRNLFKALSHAIQHHFRDRRAPYPVERTLLVTGILDAAMHSRHERRPLDTPHLEFAYEPIDFRAMREMGTSWGIITEDLPEPRGITPGGLLTRDAVLDAAGPRSAE